MSGATLESTRRDHAARLNRVLDYLEAHLGEPLELATLAEVACFSPFHFHRLFRAWTGESLGACIQRMRLEQAAQQLAYNPLKPVTDVALDCGFGSASSFARAFRAHFGCTASTWRAQNRKQGQGGRKAGTADSPCILEGWSAPGRARVLEFPMTEIPLTVRFEDLPDLSLAYLRLVGWPQEGPECFPRLVHQVRSWAEVRGLLGPESLSILVFHDHPDITPEERQRLDVALSVPEGTRGEGEIGVRRLPAGRWAMARVDITPDQYEAAWRTFMTTWLPESGCVLDDRPAMQITRRPPGPRHLVDLCLPVRPR